MTLMSPFSPSRLLQDAPRDAPKDTATVSALDINRSHRQSDPVRTTERHPGGAPCISLLLTSCAV